MVSIFLTTACKDSDNVTVQIAPSSLKMPGTSDTPPGRRGRGGGGARGGGGVGKQHSAGSDGMYDRIAGKDGSDAGVEGKGYVHFGAVSGVDEHVVRGQEGGVVK